MKQFLKKILLFSLPIVLVYIILLVLVLFSGKCDCNDIPTQLSGVTKVVVGDSHTECAIDDNIVSACKNISKSSEDYFFSYTKLKYLSEKGLLPDTVLISVGYHSMSDFADDKSSGNRSVYYVNQYFCALGLNDRLEVFNRDLSLLLKKEFITENVKRLFVSKPCTFIGGYGPIRTDKEINEEDVNNRVDAQFYKDGAEKEIADKNLMYLNDIISLCKSNGVTPILLTVPVHKMYSDKIPRKFTDKYNHIISGYAKDIHVVRLDTGVFLTRQYFLPDGDHLNELGADTISRLLNSRLH